MFLVEYKDPPSIFTNVVINKKECMFQYMSDDNITITEWVYPVVWHDDECEEISINFDETLPKLFEGSTFFKVSKKFLDVDNVSYEYTPGDILCFETRLPELCCVIPPTEWGKLDDVINIAVDDTLNITSDKFTYKYQIIHKIKNFKENLKIQSNYLEDVKSCTKVYIEENFPICLETVNPNKRVYIAPCFE
mgnify:FL=1|tara:strand:+ start:1496 stop:2071 length:576 start_codon:yes stop_codon:yes gene_type:complete